MNKPQIEGIREAVEVKPWLFKIRSLTNRRKWYDVIHRRDESFWCSCKGFKFNGDKCNHIDMIKMFLEE